MLKRYREFLPFLGFVFLSFVAHFVFCLAIRGYPTDYVKASYGFQKGTYGSGASSGQPQTAFLHKNISNRVTRPVLQAQLVPSEELASLLKQVEEPVKRSVPVIANEHGEGPRVATSPEPLALEEIPEETVEDEEEEEVPEETMDPEMIQAVEAEDFATVKTKVPENKIVPQPEPVEEKSRTRVRNGKGQGDGGRVGGRAYFPASPIRNPYPPYPRAAREAGVEGIVVVKIWVAANGKPQNVQILKSSGHNALDQQVLKTVRSAWRFKPATKHGRPVESTEECAFKFVLSEKERRQLRRF